MVFKFLISVFKHHRGISRSSFSGYFGCSFNYRGSRHICLSLGTYRHLPEPPGSRFLRVLPHNVQTCSWLSICRKGLPLNNNSALSPEPLLAFLQERKGGYVIDRTCNELASIGHALGITYTWQTLRGPSPSAMKGGSNLNEWLALQTQILPWGAQCGHSIKVMSSHWCSL